MSKRNLIIIVSGGVTLLAVSFGVAGWLGGWFGDPVFTDEIPAKRPRRLDHRLLEAFSGKSIDEIIETLMTESAATENGFSSDEAAPVPGLLAMLPDAPLPYPADATPRDADGLKKLVTRMQQDSDAKPSPAEQWQFNLALAALKVDPSEIPEANQLDTHPKPESETFPVRLVERESALFGPFALGHFVKGDGTGIVAGGGSALFSLLAGGEMETHEGLAGVTPGNGVYPADFDGDGDTDLFITRGEGLPNSLLRNDGEGNFEDVTIALGTLSFNDTTAAAWLDYDGDGLLDLLVGSSDHPLELYHQTSAGIFQPVAWDLQLWIPRGVESIAVSDFSGDGYPDFFLGITGSPDRLYLAKPSRDWSEWRFENVAAASRIDQGSGVRATFFDFDNDGWPDLLLGPKSSDPTGKPRLLRNDGKGRFADLTAEAGFAEVTGITAVTVADLDNDSYEDLVVGTAALAVNRVFWNQEGAGFKEVTIVSQGSYLDEPVAYAAADLEGNGTIDILSLDRSGAVRWLEATGAMDSSVIVKVNQAPPGCRVVLTIRDKDWVLRDIERRLGIDDRLLIGIGQADVIERLSIFSGSGGETLHVLEKVKTTEEIVIDLPKRPRQRPVVPLKKEASDTAP
jgi:hypothetical protein